MSKKCCAFGHRNLYINIDNGLKEIIVKLIEDDGVEIFFTGGNGEFDSLFSSIVLSLKRKFKSISLILVKPYMTKELNSNKDYYENFYDEIIILEELMGAHYKSAITLRNRWMIRQCDYIISGVYRNYGGAYDTIKYAKKLNKEIIEIKK